MSEIRHLALAMDGSSWDDPAVVAQRFVDVAVAALDESDTLGNHFSPLRRQHNEPLLSAGSTRRDDITVIVARFTDEA